ncbi:hypothetical protein SISSUDRAFT_728731 [Sistotremastrum suecicum HHB10207 ss-3]|uniref:Uncharacterized protein n=1 Tax=Sistotremastrum suecicum HHB10207 ss-3 TaxID=1314776 RepID=A0A165WR80_9AGAM|nr:hypothetical protein SISSUDRAFT_728731 [Sistotremastrum suecicum HHB10207 ss-3]
MSLFNQKHPYAQGPLPEISFGPCHQDSGQIDASLHDHFSIGAIYPPPIISIGREDPEALGSHVIKRNTIHQPPHEPIEEKILSSGSSATHKSNKTLPDIHAAEPGDASLFFPGLLRRSRGQGRTSRSRFRRIIIGGTHNREDESIWIEHQHRDRARRWPRNALLLCWGFAKHLVETGWFRPELQFTAEC